MSRIEAPEDYSGYIRLISDIFGLDDMRDFHFGETPEEKQAKLERLRKIEQDPDQLKQLAGEVDQAIEKAAALDNPLGLNHQESMAVRLRYNLDRLVDPDNTLEAVGGRLTRRTNHGVDVFDEIGVSRSRAQQIILKANRRLRRFSSTNPIYGFSYSPRAR